ncbi:MAG: hypothetical protein M3068_09150 [Gemmatimonadota bacterium]|nr:hypothetical protein [Gemmatimonadota bacterium]
MMDSEIEVRLRDLRHGGPACTETRRWPLATLVAYLFDGRECPEVRSLLARGSGVAHGTQVSWSPVRIAERELTEIESDFPQGAPIGALRPEQVLAVELHVPALRPVLTVPLRIDDHPLIRRAAERAAHARFDYGPWADVYVATLASHEAAELLEDPARRLSDAGSAELAARVIGEDDAALHFHVPRPDAPIPWRARD